MKKIPLLLIKDYIIAGCTLVSVLLVLHPIFLTPENRAVPLLVFKIVHALLFLLTLIISEIIVTYVFRKPFSYSDRISKKLWHFIYCTAVGVPLFNAFLNQANAIMMWDFQRFYYAWVDTDSTFTLKWYLKTLDLCFITAIIMVIAMLVLSKIRCIQNSLRELEAINEMLRQQQERDAIKGDDDTASHVERQCVLHSDYNGQDITIYPHNFIYVESVGNYANLCFIDNEQLTTTTIRTTIKQLKEDLSGNDFIVQCHRGFLVNLEYVESMEGSNGRLFLNMFYSEKKIPVSRANKITIKETLSIMQCK